MTALDERPVRARRSDVPVVEWLDAPLTVTGEPVQGDQINPRKFPVRVGDYLAEFHSDDTASWLRVSSVDVTGGRLTIRYGRGPGARLTVLPGMRLWVLRQDEAQAVLRGRRDVVVRPFGAAERAMQDRLRAFDSVADLTAWWGSDAPVEAWEQLRHADAVNDPRGAAL